MLINTLVEGSAPYAHQTSASSHEPTRLTSQVQSLMGQFTIWSFTTGHGFCSGNPDRLWGELAAFPASLHSRPYPSVVQLCAFPGPKLIFGAGYHKGLTHMLEIGLISSRIKDMQGRADALRGYL